MATAKRTAEPSHGAPSRASGSEDHAGVSVRLFDADRPDRALELEPALRQRLGDRQLLWIDVEGDLDPERADLIARRMRLAPRTRSSLVKPPERPHISLHGSYLHLRVATAADHGPGESPRWLDLVFSRGIVVSSHSEPVELLKHLDQRIDGDTTVGTIDGATFVRSVLDATVTGYLHAVDAIEDAIDDLDGAALRSRAGDGVLAKLVALRRRISRLRRAMSDQRDVFAALGAADFGAVIRTDDAADFRAVADRFEGALQSVEDCRDLLIGSFDVFMTRMTQRTNDIMKVLAMATVLLLPGSLIAGLLGMNVEVPLPKDDPLSFWLVVVAIVVLAIVVLVAARLRRWI